jgi:hypothetical protein
MSAELISTEPRSPVSVLADGTLCYAPVGVVASITVEAVRQLGLAEGSEVTAIMAIWPIRYQ